MPGSPSQIRIEEVIAARHDIETGTLLIRNNYGESIGELLAIDRVEHGSIQRAAPKALGIPGRPRP